MPANTRGDSAERVESELLEIISYAKQHYPAVMQEWPGSAISQPKIQQLAEILCSNQEVQDKNLFTTRSGQLDENELHSRIKGLFLEKGSGLTAIIGWETEVKKSEGSPMEQRRRLYCIRCTYNNMNWYIGGRLISHSGTVKQLGICIFTICNDPFK